MPMNGAACKPPVDVMLMMTPPCSFIHVAHARCASRSGPTTFTSSTLSIARSSVSIIGPNAGFVAALFTRMSSRPRRSTHCSTDAWMASGSPAEPAYVVTSAPMVRSACSVSSSSCCLRARTAIDAPAAAYASAIARPMPRVPPVTSATLPSSRKAFSGSITACSSVGSEVEAGPALGALGGHRVDVALAQDQVLVAVDLDLVAAVGREEHLVAGLDVAHRRADLHDLRPAEALADVRGGGDKDPGARLALPHLLRGLHQQAVRGDTDGLLHVSPRGCITRLVGAVGHGARG